MYDTRKHLQRIQQTVPNQRGIKTNDTIDVFNLFRFQQPLCSSISTFQFSNGSKLGFGYISIEEA